MSNGPETSSVVQTYVELSSSSSLDLQWTATTMVMGASDLRSNQDHNSDSTASDLLAGPRQLDASSWQELVDRYSWLIARWCRQQGLNNDDTPDVLQAVLLRVLQHVGDFEKDGNTAAFRRWLRAVTRSQVAEYRRNAARQPRGDGGSSAQRRFLAIAQKGSSLASSPRLESLLERFWQLVDRLEDAFEPTTWQAFWLTTFENLNS